MAKNGRRKHDVLKAQQSISEWSWSDVSYIQN